MHRNWRGLALLAAVTGWLTGGAAPEETSLALRMYASPTAHAAGDLLTVVVDESISSSTKASLNNSKESSMAAAAGVLGSETGGTLSQRLAQLDIPGYKLGGTSKFTGSGEQATEEAMTARFTARVTDVQGNGVLVVQGERKLRFKDETVTITFAGLVRPYDITSENTVLSSQVSDARIFYDRSGEVSRGSQPGFLSRLFQFINPW